MKKHFLSQYQKEKNCEGSSIQPETGVRTEMGEPRLEAACQTERHIPTGRTYEEGLGVALAEISAQNTTRAVAAWIATSSSQMISPTPATPFSNAGNPRDNCMQREPILTRPLDLRKSTNPQILAGVPLPGRVPAPPVNPVPEVPVQTTNLPSAPGGYVPGFQQQFTGASYPPPPPFHYQGHAPGMMYPYQQQQQHPRPCYYDHGGRCYECSSSVYNSSGPCPGPGGQYYYPHPSRPPPYQGQGWNGDMRHFPIVPIPRYAGASDPRGFPYHNFFGPVEGSQDWISSNGSASLNQRFNPEYYGYPVPQPTIASGQMLPQILPQTQPGIPGGSALQIGGASVPSMPAVPSVQPPGQIAGTPVAPVNNAYFYSPGPVLRSPEQGPRPTAILPQYSEAVTLPQPTLFKAQSTPKYRVNTSTASGTASDPTRSSKKKKVRTIPKATASIESSTLERILDTASFADMHAFGDSLPNTPEDPDLPLNMILNMNNSMEQISNPELTDPTYQFPPEKDEILSEKTKLRKKNTPRKKKGILKELAITSTASGSSSNFFKTPASLEGTPGGTKRKRLSEGIGLSEDRALADEQEEAGRSEEGKEKTSPLKKVTKKKKKSKAEDSTPVPTLLNEEEEARKDNKATMLNKLRYRLRSAFAVAKAPAEVKKVSPGTASIKSKKLKVRKIKKTRSLGATPNKKTVLSPPIRKGLSPDIVTTPGSLGSGNDSIDSTTSDIMPALDIHFSAEKEKEILIKMRSWTLNKSEGETVLHRAATLGLPDVVSYCMSRQIMLNPNCVNNHGYSPLHDACVHGNEKVVEALLTFRAGPSKKAPGGVRPLHLAAKNGHIEIVKLLLSRGADPSLKTEEGQSVMDIAEESVKLFLASLPSPSATLITAAPDNPSINVPTSSDPPVTDEALVEGMKSEN